MNEDLHRLGGFKDGLEEDEKVFSDGVAKLLLRLLGFRPRRLGEDVASEETEEAEGDNV